MQIRWYGSAADASIGVYSPEGRQIAELSAETLDRHIRAGRLSCAALIDRSPGAEARLARLLVLLACAQACASGMACVARDCPMHASSAESVPLALGLARIR